MANRSWLFVPGDSERKLAKVASVPADVVIVDLEDAVAPEAKPAARQQAHDWLQAHRRQVVEGPQQGHWVRINALDTDWWRDDLAAVMPAAPHGIVLPKAAGPQQVQQLTAELYEYEARFGLPTNSTRILPLVSETPAAALGIPAYASTLLPRLAGLTWGAEDLSAAIGATRKKQGNGQWTDAFRWVRSQVLLTCHAAGVLAVDTLQSDFRDLAGLKRTAEAARADGFHGMMAIHPDQVAIINAAFTPSEAERAEAQAIIDAFAENPGIGALSLNGRMIDIPHLAQARRLLGV